MKQFSLSLLIVYVVLALLITFDLSTEIISFLKIISTDVLIFLSFFLILLIDNKRELKKGKIASSFPGIKWGLVDLISIFAAIRIWGHYVSFKKLGEFVDKPIYDIIGFCILFLAVPLVIYKYKQNLKDLGFVLGKQRFYIRKAFRWGTILFIYRLILVWLEEGRIFPSSCNFGTTAYVFFSVGILGPIAEEVFFRGFGYPVFRKYVGVKPAILFNALLFSLYHFYLPIHLSTFRPVYFLGYLLIGSGLAYLFEKSRSLAAPITFHCMLNISGVLVYFISSSRPF